jgi:hypothetical protein
LIRGSAGGVDGTGATFSIRFTSSPRALTAAFT